MLNERIAPGSAGARYVAAGRMWVATGILILILISKNLILKAKVFLFYYFFYFFKNTAYSLVRLGALV